MSLAIDIDHVSEVLITGHWYTVAKTSFALDSYEFIWYPTGEARRRHAFELLHGGGNSGVCAIGFSFRTEHGDMIAGPLTAITAVRYRHGGM